MAGTLEQKFYFDEAYDAVLARPTQRLAVFLKRSIEEPLILSSLGEIAGSVREFGQRFSRLQTGLLRSYALALAAGLALIAVVFIAVR